MTSEHLSAFHGRPVHVGLVDGQRVVVPGRTATRDGDARRPGAAP
jgi:hypothetical protein